MKAKNLFIKVFNMNESFFTTYSFLNGGYFENAEVAIDKSGLNISLDTFNMNFSQILDCSILTDGFLDDWIVGKMKYYHCYRCTDGEKCFTIEFDTTEKLEIDTNTVKSLYGRS